MASYSYICLLCGGRYSTDRETYAQKRENPICDRCAQAYNTPTDTQPDTFMDEITGLLIRGVRKFEAGQQQRRKNKEKSSKEDTAKDPN